MNSKRKKREERKQNKSFGGIQRNRKRTTLGIGPKFSQVSTTAGNKQLQQNADESPNFLPNCTRYHNKQQSPLKPIQSALLIKNSNCLTTYWIVILGTRGLARSFCRTSPLGRITAIRMRPFILWWRGDPSECSIVFVLVRYTRSARVILPSMSDILRPNQHLTNIQATAPLLFSSLIISPSRIKQLFQDLQLIITV